MGRVFVIELEGPAYTCIECHTHIGVPSDIISKEIEEVFDIHDNDIIYDFSRLFNTFLAENTFYSALQSIFCVGCANIIGIYNVRKDPQDSIPPKQSSKKTCVCSCFCGFFLTDKPS